MKYGPPQNPLVFNPDRTVFSVEGPQNDLTCAQAKELSNYLNSRQIAGVRFVPTNFSPESGSYAGQACAGVNIIVIDRTVLDAPEVGIEIAAALRHLYPNQYEIDRHSESTASKATLDSLLDGMDPRRISAGWRNSIDQFEQARQKYLIYR
jgi:uncharacterized protein YbbC (DUF1343 family)